ncbi:hypothetical protein [Dyella flagellata]|uniref:Uncharacterized protein n=1 Tax=Dyella flagellata TaxID=1867833 RepID=A0ABQ5XB08_9GAMM|nr:hypothetical protein [Dyella flagellata]GLQ87801.1 hypothetical protein GCM10007898_13690 [Dyella flagellata]
MAMTRQAMPVGPETFNAVPASRAGVRAVSPLQRRVDGSSRQAAQQLQVKQLQKSAAPIQCLTYEKTVQKPADFDVHAWPGSLSAGGKDANSEIASKVNETLEALGWRWRCMSAHMIPKRLGGLGNNSNVRPWSQRFESGEWEEKMEQGFNQEMQDAEVGDEVTYKVQTQDMSDGTANKYVASLSGDKAAHKERIKKIPVSVKGEVNGEEKINSAGCFPGPSKLGLVGGAGAILGAAAGIGLGSLTLGPIAAGAAVGAAGALVGSAAWKGLGWLAGY